jgi:hypothetical protein
MDEEDLYLQPIDHRFRIDSESDLFAMKPYQEFIRLLQEQYPGLENHPSFLNDLKKFIHTVPRLPGTNKTFQNPSSLQFHLSPCQSREEIIKYLSEIRNSKFETPTPASITVDLAFYAGRFMEVCDWKPFFKATFERNPVSLGYFGEKDMDGVYQELVSWPDESIYEGNRLALPDEVVNYRRGDGIEKAITLIHVARSRHLGFTIQQTPGQITIKSGKDQFCFKTGKELKLPSVD